MSAEPPESNESTFSGARPVGNTTNPELFPPYPFLSPPRAIDEIGRLGGYRVIRLLGSGGMGYVFEAEELALHRRVALKVLKPELAAEPAHRVRFLREARAAAAINSDHVVTIYQVSDKDIPHLAMQFLEGESLQTRLEGPNPITLRLALEITRQAALGLAAAHEKGLIHRDIKPANLWLELDPVENASSAGPVLRAPRAEFRRLKILDFGLARRVTGEPSLTSTGFIVGTPNYMSPEQASGGDVDGRADLFSLGCVLYTMLTRDLAFPGSSAMAVMMALANRTPPPVNQRNPAIPQGVADLAARLLEKDPDGRPQSARELVASLDGLLANLTDNITLPTSSLQPSQHAPVSGAETEIPPRGDTWPPPPTARLPAPAAKPRTKHTKTALAWIVVVGAITLAAVIGYNAFRKQSIGGAAEPEPIVVGVLHSQTGTMAVSEKPVIEATLFAIEEINAAGGLLGRPVKAVIADGKSDPDEFARQAEKMLTEDRVAAMFGCWTSASREAVRDVIRRRNDGLLFYPVQYEGLGHSPRIVYLGPAPNQQLIPLVEFVTRPVAAGGLGKKRLYLIGSDYLFPRVAHEIIRDQVKSRDGVEIIGETFLPLGSTNVLPAVTDLKMRKADAIINTINGGTNFHFFKALRDEKIAPATIPTFSVSITENEVRGLNPTTLAGDYLAASYFQTVDTPESREFLRRLRQRYGPTRMATDPVAAAYTGVHLWAKAVAKAGTTEFTAVIQAVRETEFDGVRGRIQIDADTLHAWLPARIGRLRPDGLVDLVKGAGSDQLIQPVPYPSTRQREEWDQLVVRLQLLWNGKWQAPDEK